MDKSVSTATPVSMDKPVSAVVPNGRPRPRPSPSPYDADAT